MGQGFTSFQERIAAGKPLLVAQVSPPQGADPAPVRELARRFSGKVHALGISDNRDKVGMSALAAAALVADQSVEPILHVTTRDRNRIALVSEALGAQALGVRNLLCTSGSHQTLGRFRTAKNVYDVDCVQLVQTYAHLAADAGLVSEKGIEGAGPFCLGAVASPDADPLALQVSRLRKKVQAGATFLITQPVYDLERFHTWWEAVSQCGLPQQVAILAGIEPLSEEELSKIRQGQRSPLRIPQSTLDRIDSAASPAGRHSAAVEIAVETIRQLSTVPGLRGFDLCGDGDAETALEIIDRSGLAGHLKE
jgi:methylenetetrahydrofolate reductase (NADPH)